MTQDASPYAKKCANCDAPINYAYKGHVIGWCGKCTDQLRNLFKDDLRRDLQKELGGSGGVISRQGGGKLVLGLVLGLLLGFGGAVGTAVFAPEAWSKVTSAVAGAAKK